MPAIYATLFVEKNEWILDMKIQALCNNLYFN